MKKGENMRIKIVLALFIGLVLSSCAYIPGVEKVQDTAGYKLIDVKELQNLMDTKDFTFVNVHIPLEGNIPATDQMIPFDEMENYLDKLPKDKDEKIIIYCRSGSMGNIASQTLVDLGYTDVSNLEGGYNVWKAAGLPFEE
jgi:rhodanese-related sulfurtransferase